MGPAQFLKSTRRLLATQYSTSSPNARHTQDCDEDALYSYTTGRWLWNEEDQLSRRYVKFNIQELCRIAARSVGSTLCVGIEKLSEGNFNKTFLLSMDDNSEVIARVPNPNAGHPHSLTASEVATMDFVKNVLGVPAPKVLAWDATNDNPVQANYIIMEKMPGKELALFWDDMDGKQKFKILEQLVHVESQFASTKFSKSGSLYYTSDVKDASPQEALYVDADSVEHDCSRFYVGPSTSRMFFDDGRDLAELDRGPWPTAEGYVTAAARREIACINKFKHFPTPQGLFNGPGQYRPSKRSRLSVLHNYLKVAKYLLPEDDLRSSVLWHCDQHTDNIFVLPDDPTKIVGIIDWQSVHLGPLFLQTRHPALINFDGPIPESFDIELPSNFDSLSAEEKKKAEMLVSSQSLYKLYEVLSFKNNNKAYGALRLRETSLACRVTGMVGSIFTDGEPIVQGMLMTIQREWEKIAPTGTDGHPIPCPLEFTEFDRAQQKEDQAQWEKGVELMEEFAQAVGAYSGWDGWVNHAQYDAMKASLKNTHEGFLDYHCKNEAERVEWIKALPFKLE